MFVGSNTGGDDLRLSLKILFIIIAKAHSLVSLVFVHSQSTNL
jgi:hypothetical protein